MQGASDGASLPDDPRRQKTWDLPVVKRNWDNMLREVDQVSRARYLATVQEKSGAVSSLGTLLDSESFRVAIAFKKGTDISIPHYCDCSGRLDSKGLYGLSCKYSAARF